jgi:cyclopropane fatty-acyl-phospholipid synthase-like methyltransferase
MKTEIRTDTDILDIGCGCGDSTNLLSGMKPRSIRGITSTFAQSEISRRRFPEIQFINCDAVQYVGYLPSESIDLIFALDCAYHFSSRTNFLKQSSRALRVNGQIVLTDLILGDDTTLFQRMLMRIICLLTGLPYCNFKVESAYRHDFQGAGFSEIDLEDISDDVFPRLEHFIQQHQKEMTSFGIRGKWTGFLIFARILAWWKTGVVRFIVVNATRPEAT